MGLFHQYDIRGIYGKELNEKFAYILGKAVLKYTGAKKIIIGYDSRIGNLSLFSSISKAFIEEGIDVVHAGIATRPMLNWIAIQEKFDLGIVITASHNPSEYNGFKFIWKGKLLNFDNGLNDVELLVKKMSSESFKPKTKKGKIISIDYIDKYVKFLSKNLSPAVKTYLKKKNIRIVADCSSGSSGEVVKRFLLTNGITFKLQYDEPDGKFPGHNPNPISAGAMDKVCAATKKFGADFGVMFDPDADRIGFCDENGRVVNNNFIDCLIVEGFKGKQAIVHDLISLKILSDTIVKKKFKDVVSKVGTANIIGNMEKNKAVYGSEVSGHRCFRIMNNQDSAMMSLVFILNATYGKKLSKLVSKYDKYVELGEMNYKLDLNADKGKILENVKNYFEKNKKKYSVKEMSFLDGVQVICSNYWFTVRFSNTEPLVRLRIEGKNKTELLEIKTLLENLTKA